MRSYFSVTALKIICLSLGFDNMPVMNLSVSLFGIIPLGVCYLLGSVYLCFQSNLGSFWPLFFLPFLPLTLWTPMMCVFVPVIISVQNVRLSFFFILFYLLLEPDNFNCPFFKFTVLFSLFEYAVEPFSWICCFSYYAF